MAPGLYVHVPFCRSKCPYCGFYSVPSATPVPLWLEGIKKEVLFYEGRFGRFDSLYLGGGTPTFLDDATLSGLIAHISTHLDLAHDTEITIEANPCDLSTKKVRLLKDLRINRVSVGVQSFDDDTLRFLGRRHTGAEAMDALRRLRRAGFDNVGLDLIYGLPGQTLGAWKETLGHALSFEPEHISCYELTLEKGTVFGRLLEKGGMYAPSEEDGRSFFLAAADLLNEAGYIHYEVSSYARAEAFCSRHNTKYWDRSPYLGLGPSAHSFDGKNRWWNVRSIRGYGTMLGSGQSPVEGKEVLAEEQMQLESLALGFRTSQGVALRELASGYQPGSALSTLEADGLVTILDGRVIPTEKGFLLADQFPVYFS